MLYAYRDRKTKKREFRSLWIQRINAGARAEGMTYAQLINGLNKSKIKLDRKVLPELPYTNPEVFKTKVKNAKKFLVNKDKVKFTVKFKGREMQHINLGKDLMNRIIEDTKDVGKIETHPKFEGKQMVMIIQPI